MRGYKPYSACFTGPCANIEPLQHDITLHPRRSRSRRVILTYITMKREPRLSPLWPSFCQASISASAYPGNRGRGKPAFQSQSQSQRRGMWEFEQWQPARFHVWTRLTLLNWMEFFSNSWSIFTAIMLCRASIFNVKPASSP